MRAHVQTCCTRLQQLSIDDCDSLASLPAEYRGLKQLSIVGCPRLHDF